MDLALLIMLGAAAGAGLLAGLLGIGGGIVVVPVVFYGLVATHLPYDQAAHVAVATSLAAILPAALVSSFAHWREGNPDLEFLRGRGPGIAIDVAAAQIDERLAFPARLCPPRATGGPAMHGRGDLHGALGRRPPPTAAAKSSAQEFLRFAGTK